jgi:manganese transport system ATP-binding protein
MIAVELERVTVAYGQLCALRDVTLSVTVATAVGIIGANGSGKSTLLKTIAGLLRPVHGTVRVLSRAPRRCSPGSIAYVPQIEAVDWSFPATVRDVVSMGRFTHLPFYRFFGAADRALVDAAIGRLQLSDLSDRRISALSGGQQQRVFLARALASEAELLLLDEPMTGIDAASEEVLREVVRGLVAGGKTVLMTTHDLQSTGAWFDRVLVLDKAIIADGTPEAVAALEMDVACEHGHGHARMRSRIGTATS